jgi:hypothetical protein
LSNGLGPGGFCHWFRLGLGLGGFEHTTPAGAFFGAALFLAGLDVTRCNHGFARLQPLGKTLYLTGGVNDALRPRKERVAVGADVHMDFFFCRANVPGCAARAAGE